MSNKSRVNQGKPAVFLIVIVLCPLLIASCGEYSGGYGSAKSVDYQLQGTWKSNDYDSAVYKGTLVITYNRITINGYGEDQTPLLGSDSSRPFKNFTKGTPLKAYTEEGSIFIEDGGALQAGVPYIYWDDYSPPDYKHKQFLRFIFGTRQETLQKTQLP